MRNIPGRCLGSRDIVWSDRRIGMLFEVTDGEHKGVRLPLYILLEHVDRGLYRLADAPTTELNSLAEVSKRVPHAVICLLSALQVHGMTTEAPHAVWVLIDRHARLPKVTSPTLEVVRASGAAREHGIETRVIDEVKVQLTEPAKTVADCFRFRRHVGLEVALAALKDYLTKRKGSIDELVDAAHTDRIHAFMRPYLEALA